VVLYLDESRTDISGAYEMPVCLYYHCDFAYEDSGATQTALQTAEAFRRKFGYNFVTEEQMMRATAAAYNLDIAVSEQDGAFTVIPSAAETESALYDEAYQNCCGIKISFGENADAGAYATDADVWYQNGNELYIGLNKPVTIWPAEDRGAQTHIQQINTPAVVSRSEQGALVTFLENGMQQLTVCGHASTDSVDWKTETRDGLTVFTHYGAACELNLTF
jgi:hypothetical protein